MKGAFAILLLFFIGIAAQAQSFADDDRKDIIPVLGRILTADSLVPISNTHVISKMAHRGTISNRDGEFYILTRKTDTLWVSCLGYSRRLVPIDSTVPEKGPLLIRLKSDTVMLREVVVRPFYDYETFKEMVINMPSLPVPREIQRLYQELNDPTIKSKNLKNKGMVSVTASPVQYFYDKYNKQARLRSKILKNRRRFNEVLREQGRTDELLPDSLDFQVEYQNYDYIKLGED